MDRRIDIVLLENIRTLATENKISITELERQAGLSNGAIGKWKDASPRVETLKKVAAVLHTTVDALISE